jgi:transcriptional regulator with XRE-family HTH domain
MSDPYYAIASLIGGNIRDKRTDSDLSQRELGRRVFVSHRTISDYERGVRVPSAARLFMISVALNCKPWQLWE